MDAYLPPLAVSPRAAPQYRVLQRDYGGSQHSLGAMAVAARDGEADPVVRQWALSAVRQVTPRDYLSEIAAIFYKDAREHRYTRDPAHIEQISHPRVVIDQRAGDCDCKSALITAALRALGQRFGSVGVPIEFVAVGFKPADGDDPYSHVFIRVRNPNNGQWVVVDTVAGPYTAEMLRKVRHILTYSV